MEFQPNLIERMIGTPSGRFKYRDILNVSIIGVDLSGASIFAGGIRRRLSVQLRNENLEIFVVGEVDTVAAQLEEAASLEPVAGVDPAKDEAPS